MALVEERAAAAPRRSEPLAPRAAPRLPLEPVLYVALVVVGFWMRVHQAGERALHHDESLHALYSWYLYVGRGYVHDPMMHGPFQFHWPAFIYFLFGDSDFTARLPAILFGTAIIGLPYLLRHDLGRVGALIAAALFTISPSFLYFSRFLREDIYTAAWTLLMVAGIFGFVRTRDARYFYLASIGLAFSFATKEVTFITGFIVVTFVLLALALPGSRAEMLAILRALTPRTWLVGAGLFLAINVVLYTTFFTNPRGLCTALWSFQPICGAGQKGALQYWLEQHDVQRGGQPVYYYVMLLLLYEFLPLALAGIGSVALWSRRNLFFGFLLYWFAAAFVIYSQAGEKMPWLLLHLTLPLVLLAGLYLGRAVQTVEWRRVWGWPGLGALCLTLVGLAAAAAWLNLGAAETLAPLYVQTATLRRLGLSLVVAASAAALAYLWTRYGGGVVKPAALGAVALVALFFYIHYAFTVTYAHGDIASEPLVYVQSSPDVPWVVREIERIGFQYGEGKNVGLLLDNGWGDGVHESVAWPFEWYLRDFTNKRYFTRTIGPEVDLTRYPVMLVMATNVEPLRPILSEYHGQKYRLNWWFPEEYKSFDASLKVGPLTIPWLKWDLLLRKLADPAERANLLKFLVYRDAQPAGAREFYFYVRNDVPALGPAPFAGTAQAAQPAAQREAIAQAAPDGAVIFGRNAVGRSVLVEPKDVAVDANGRIYVVEARAHRVSVFNPDGSLAASWGRQGAGDGEFNEPWGIGLAPNGDVYVADTWNHRVQRFSSDGRFLGKFGRLFDPQRPLAEQLGAFWGPRDVAVAPDGTVYVTDTGNKRVQVFDPQGRPLRAFGTEGSGEGQFREPVGLALDAQGNLLVADTWNGRVQRVDPQGRFLAAYPIEGWESTSVLNKPYLAVRDQRILVSQPERNRILVIGDDGRASPLTSSTSLQLPTGIAVDGEGRVIVSDSRAGVVVRLP